MPVSSKAARLTDRDEDDFQRDTSNRGVVYLSRIPAGMQVNQLRSRLGRFGTVERVFLKPTLRTKSQESRKKKAPRYSSGWVEFHDKKDAKKAAELLNNTSAGASSSRGKRKRLTADEMWNMKYLPGFSWNNLTEQMAYEKRIRQQRVKNEVSAARRERDFYLEKVDQAKMVEEIRERRKEKKRKERAEEERDAVDDEDVPRGTIRVFAQREAQEEGNGSKPKRLSTALLRKVMSER